MATLPLSTEMIDFATNVARATYGDRLDWETTADEDVLIAPLGGPYTARLQRVWRRDSDGDPFDVIELTLLKGREALFELDGDLLQNTAFARLRTSSNSWGILRDMWARAILKAKKVTEELNAVNKLLGDRLKGLPIDDDEEVPF